MIRISARDVTPRKCEQCEKPFVPMKGSAGRFCSRQCSGAYRTAHLERFLCDHCGKLIEHRVSQSNEYQHSFCSHRCHDDFRIADRQKKLVKRFWKYVVVSDDCWGWSGTLDEKGYGRVRTWVEDRWIPRLAHRVSWELHRGPIPDGLSVLHSCDNPPCTRPEHLFLGNQLDNMQDCASKDRHTRGERSATAKLTEAQVIEMRARFAAGERNYSKLGREYGVSAVQVRSIILRERWKYLT
jgi:endogenous inhibitor of DNA gyrase (YacG/DUF329 family)